MKAPTKRELKRWSKAAWLASLRQRQLDVDQDAFLRSLAGEADRAVKRRLAVRPARARRAEQRRRRRRSAA
jgi:hypothetical protein